MPAEAAWGEGTTRAQAYSGHAVTGRDKRHAEADAKHGHQLQVGSPAPRYHILSPRCVLPYGTGNVGVE